MFRLQTSYFEAQNIVVDRLLATEKVCWFIAWMIWKSSTVDTVSMPKYELCGQISDLCYTLMLIIGHIKLIYFIWLIYYFHH